MNTMRDMKNMHKKRDDRAMLAKTVADGIVLFTLLICLCIMMFSMTPYTGGV